MNARKIFLLVLILGFAALAVILIYRNYVHQDGHEHSQVQKSLYYCPMHPDYTSDKPGSCPICGMDLVKQETAEKTSDKQKIKFYRNPMKPEITSPVPMKDEMGMDYIPVYEEDEKTNVRGSVSIDMDRQRLIGLKTGTAEKKELILRITSPGKIAYDPELYHAISEYREAFATLEKTKNSPWTDVRERAEMLIISAKLKLKQLGIPDTLIEEIKTSSETYTNLLLSSEDKTAWAYINVYEYEIGLIKPGRTVAITAPAYPDRKFKGIIKSIDSIISKDTRTLRVRAEILNSDGLLKPEMYVDADIIINLGKKLVIPSDSVLDTGKKKIIFAARGEEKFEPREIKTGRSNGEYVEVLNGLKEGEKIVISSNFLIDSESRLKSALEK